MTSQITPVALPHEQREHVLSQATFAHPFLGHEWTITRTRPLYTDPGVLRPQWLVCPNGASYPERTFYRSFGRTNFRRLLRYLLTHAPCTCETLAQALPQDTQHRTDLSFLLDQAWFHLQGRWLERGTYQAHISNIGRTLEWYVAEWFRLTYSRSRLIPVYHGVELAELPVQGDLDVVARLDASRLIMVECKSASHVDETRLTLFIQRTQALQPDLAILLIDTTAPFHHLRISACNAALAQHGYPALKGSQGLYSGALGIYLVNVAHSIAHSLTDVLNYHHQRTQTLPSR